MIVKTEWSEYEIDEPANRIRFLGQHTTPTGGPLAKYIGKKSGVPICVTMAKRDADGWFKIEPGSLVCIVGKPMTFRHVLPHNFPNYIGTKVLEIRDR